MVAPAAWLEPVETVALVSLDQMLVVQTVGRPVTAAQVVQVAMQARAQPAAAAPVLQARQVATVAMVQRVEPRVPVLRVPEVTPVTVEMVA